jgi:hypothetical protein
LHAVEDSPSPMDAGTTTVRAVLFKNCPIRSRMSFSFMVHSPPCARYTSKITAKPVRRKNRDGLRG